MAFTTHMNAAASSPLIIGTSAEVLYREAAAPAESAPAFLESWRAQLADLEAALHETLPRWLVGPWFGLRLVRLCAVSRFQGFAVAERLQSVSRSRICTRLIHLCLFFWFA